MEMLTSKDAPPYNIHKGCGIKTKHMRYGRWKHLSDWNTTFPPCHAVQLKIAWHWSKYHFISAISVFKCLPCFHAKRRAENKYLQFVEATINNKTQINYSWTVVIYEFLWNKTLVYTIQQKCEWLIKCYLICLNHCLGIANDNRTSKVFFSPRNLIKNRNESTLS